MLRGVRLDLTEDRLFTLSESTHQVLRAIDEPVTVRFFFSRALAGQSPIHANYAVRVRELLEHYVDLAAGKLRLEVHDPEAYSVTEDAAVSLGLQGIPLDRKGNVVYFGLAAVNSTDDREVIAFFDPEREPFLEYDLTRPHLQSGQPEEKSGGAVEFPEYGIRPGVEQSAMGRAYPDATVLRGTPAESANDRHRR